MKMIVRASALAASCVLVLSLSSQGCSNDGCKPNESYISYYGIYRCFPLAETDPPPIDAGPDGDAEAPEADQPGWSLPAYEFHSPEPSKPPPIVVAGDRPADPPGPKDPAAVVAAGIFTQSCIDGMYSNMPRINRAIYEMYYTLRRDPTIQSFFARSSCFKNRANGCIDVAECLGYVKEIYKTNQPLDTMKNKTTCIDGIRRYTGPPGTGETTINTWFNCKAFGLECFTDRIGEPCSTQRTPCDPAVDTKECDGDRPYQCSDSYNLGKFYSFQYPDCSEFGMKCLNRYYCAPEGPACTPNGSYSHSGQVFNYGIGGIACDSPTTLRICMDGHETTIECSSLADGFTCIPGAEPRCGFADECDLDGLTYCEGDSVVLCDAGKVRKVDCKSLGFTGCNKDWGVCSPGIYDYFKKP